MQACIPHAAHVQAAARVRVINSILEYDCDGWLGLVREVQRLGQWAQGRVQSRAEGGGGSSRRRCRQQQGGRGWQQQQGGKQQCSRCRQLRRCWQQASKELRSACCWRGGVRALLLGSQAAGACSSDVSGSSSSQGAGQKQWPGWLMLLAP
jgi:hypothetical protein